MAEAMEEVVSSDPPECISENHQPHITSVEVTDLIQSSQLNVDVSNRCPDLTAAMILTEKEIDRDGNEINVAVADSDDSNKLEIGVNDAGDRNYESEPVSGKQMDSKKKFKKRANWNSQGAQGRSNFTRHHVVSKEMRELSRKHAILEKNLKIEGLPEPAPKPRKRRLSLSSNIGRPQDKDITPYKRKRLASVDTRPRRDHMPKWELMGGDANDPLNLNGLAHSEEGRLLNLKTPESSPLPTPDFRKIVYVKVPPNIEDPLNLEGKHDQRVIDKMLNSTVKKRHRSKKKKHDDNQQGLVTATTTSSMQPCTNIPEEVAVTETVAIEPDSQSGVVEGVKENAESKPVFAMPMPAKSVTLTGRRSRSISTSPERKFRRQLSGGKGRACTNEPKKFPDKPAFTLGNYNRYYGYRNQDHVPDPRLQYFDPAWFKGKDVLDIGCNVGHITLAVAEHLHPHKILGMDIDAKLIQAARQNIRHMLSMRRKDSARCPTVFEMTRGPLEAHPLMGLSDKFPNNVMFLQGNYVPGSEEILNLQKEELDTILALSITKWIHLNNGDDGLKLFFQKIYRQLRPGGRLILEPQPWSTYRKRAKLSPELFAKYQSIKLKPEGFKHYLLSIGFVKCEVIGVPVTKSKGFRRPLILFTKGDNRQTPNVVTGDDLDVRDVCQECGNTNKSLCDHPQFTGLRRGPYASHMYDHFSYPYTSSDSPYVSSSRTYSNHSVLHGGDDSISYAAEVEGMHGTGRRSEASEFNDNGGAWGNGGVLKSRGGSEVTDSRGGSDVTDSSSTSSGSASLSSTSYESQSGSTSSQSFSSSNVCDSDSVCWSGSSYFSPNGDSTEELFNPGSVELNGDVDHVVHLTNFNGGNGESSRDDSSGLVRINGNLVNQLMDVSVDSPPVGVSTASSFLGVSVDSQPVGVSTASSFLGVSVDSPPVGVSTASSFMGVSVDSPPVGVSTASSFLGISVDSPPVGVSTASSFMGVSVDSPPVGVSTASSFLGVIVDRQPVGDSVTSSFSGVGMTIPPLDVSVENPLIGGSLVNPPLSVAMAIPPGVSAASSLLDVNVINPPLGGSSTSPSAGVTATSPSVGVTATGPHNIAASSSSSSDVPQSPVSVVPPEDITDAVYNSNSSEQSERVIHDADFDDDTAGTETGASDDQLHDGQLTEPMHSSSSMNGDHGLVVVQNWENDDQNANLDASLSTT